MQRDVLFLAEMLDAAQQAHEIANEASIDDLAKDRRLHDAFAWNFTVLGEAASKVTDETKARFPELPWEQPVRLRNRIAHGYWSLDLAILHTTAIDQLPSFVEQLGAVLTVLETEAGSGPS